MKRQSRVLGSGMLLVRFLKLGLCEMERRLNKGMKKVTVIDT